MGRIYTWEPRTMRNLALVQSDRSYYNIETLITNRLKAASNFVERLDLEALLKRHAGCVNCIEWSSDGKLLASGSDDNRVIIWNAFEHKMKLDILTPHQGNIFSVKFIPGSSDALVASGAADGNIFVFDINRDAEPTPQWRCKCHTQRVKRLATVPDAPHMLWSSGEDGKILQFDIREPHVCGNEKVQLIDLQNHIGPSAEAKCVAVNHRRPEQLAVGASDVYARIYDRRMIRLNRLSGLPTNESRSSDNLSKSCVNYYCPGHLNRKIDRYASYTAKTITYLTFSPDGNELLVNMGSEQIYLYDLNNAERPTYLNLQQTMSEYAESPNETAERPVNENVASTSASQPTDEQTSSQTYTKSSKLPDHIEDMKAVGNELMEKDKYWEAINQYTDCINAIPKHPVFYLNRATAYMRRNWYGDLYAGLKDCEMALQLDPTYAKAHFRMTRALFELGFVDDANQCLSELKRRFPADTNNKQTKMLADDIQSHLDREEDVPSLSPSPDLSRNELHWRTESKDFSERFIGHCNTTTDIKEANYFGGDGSYVIAGSDEGYFYIWERPSNKIFSVYKGDSMIVNCVQPHPYCCMLATSGIDHEIRLWSPKPENGKTSEHRVVDIDAKVIGNQQRMQSDPFELNATGAVCRTS